MVASQLRTNAVNDPRVVAAMARVPRERFVPEGDRWQAYRDGPLPLPNGRQLNLPMATGRLLTEAAVRPTDHVLLIGAASGYAAAVLAELAARVVAVESDPQLVEIARASLAGIANVELVAGALAAGHPDGAPYDVLVVDGAVKVLPDALVQQIKPDGRCVAGQIDRGVTRLSFGRRSPGGFGLAAFADAECVVLPGFAKPHGFSF